MSHGYEETLQWLVNNDCLLPDIYSGLEFSQSDTEGRRPDVSKFSAVYELPQGKIKADISSLIMSTVVLKHSRGDQSNRGIMI